MQLIQPVVLNSYGQNVLLKGDFGPPLFYMYKAGSQQHRWLIEAGYTKQKLDGGILTTREERV